MKPLIFRIGEYNLTMDVSAQLIPADQTIAWGGDTSKRYGTLSNTGSNSGEGLDFTIGQMFLERYYSVGIGVLHHSIGFDLEILTPGL